VALSVINCNYASKTLHFWDNHVDAVLPQCCCNIFLQVLLTYLDLDPPTPAGALGNETAWSYNFVVMSCKLSCESLSKAMSSAKYKSVSHNHNKNYSTRSTPSLNTFRTQLKTELFQRSFKVWLVDVLWPRSNNTHVTLTNIRWLTYLLTPQKVGINDTQQTSGHVQILDCNRCQ